jgi:chromosome segregation ATPase
MAKVRFTKEHYVKMSSLAFAMLIANETISTKMGQPLNIVDLLHTTTIGTLNDIRLGLAKQIEKLESQDEWVASDYTQEKLESLKKQKELVNLIIGWKRYKLEAEETKRKKAELTEQLKNLKESTKTPEDRIKELEAQLAGLDAEEDF